MPLEHSQFRLRFLDRVLISKLCLICLDFEELGILFKKVDFGLRIVGLLIKVIGLHIPSKI